MKHFELVKKYAGVAAGAVLILLIALGYGGYRYYELDAAYQAAVQRFSAELADASSTNQVLADALAAEKQRNDDFENEINSITGSVGTITKLVNTDPQLLAKYSKVYFLNENYIPASLSDIPAKDAYDPKQTYRFLTNILPHLEDLISDARDAGANLEVISAYRSFGEQAALKSEYKTVYGSGANAFSADQGYSEHQLGTTVDFTTPDIGATFNGFDGTKAYAWLDKNAYIYGFTLSYPKDNSYYVYEPWHWRYVGVRLATWLHDINVHFYDVEQRTINTYLVDFYDD